MSGNSPFDLNKGENTEIQKYNSSPSLKKTYCYVGAEVQKQFELYLNSIMAEFNPCYDERRRKEQNLN